jgi:hypothetical protein
MTLTMEDCMKSRTAHKAIAAPLLIVGLEWLVSAANKYLGGFVAHFPAYATALQQERLFLPGLHVLAMFPKEFAYLALATESLLAFVLIAAAFIFWRGISRTWDVLAAAAVTVSAVMALGLYLMVGHPPFWPDPSSSGYASGWPIEFFLASMSAALAVAIAVADPAIAPAALLAKFATRIKVAVSRELR